MYVWGVNSTITKHSDYFVPERVARHCDDTSWHEVDEFSKLKSPKKPRNAFSDALLVTFSKFCTWHRKIETWFWLIDWLIKGQIWFQTFRKDVCFTGCCLLYAHLLSRTTPSHEDRSLKKKIQIQASSWRGNRGVVAQASCNHPCWCKPHPALSLVCTHVWPRSSSMTKFHLRHFFRGLFLMYRHFKFKSFNGVNALFMYRELAGAVLLHSSNAWMLRVYVCMCVCVYVCGCIKDDIVIEERVHRGLKHRNAQQNRKGQTGQERET